MGEPSENLNDTEVSQHTVRPAWVQGVVLTAYNANKRCVARRNLDTTLSKLSPLISPPERHLSKPESTHVVEQLWDLIQITGHDLGTIKAAAGSDGLALDGLHWHNRMRLRNTAELLWKQFEYSRCVEDLNILIEFENRALQQTLEKDPERARWLSRLGISYQYRFDQLGHLEDLGKAVHFQYMAVFNTAIDCPERLGYMNNLGNSFHSLFQQLGRLDDLHKSICYIEQAVSSTPNGHPDKPGRLNNLGNSYQSLYQQLGGLDALNKSTNCFERAVLLTPNSHPNMPALLNNLGSSYQARFWQLGRLDDLHQAAGCIEQAVLLTPERHPHKPGLLNNLGDSYHSLFQQLGRLDDIDKSVSYFEQAVLLTPDGHPYKPGRLNNLGSSYQSRFQRLGRLDDLHESVCHKEQSVLLTPDNHPNKPGRLSNLGISYESRFQQLGRLDDLHKSFGYFQQAVSLTPNGHLAKPGYLNNLGNSYESLNKRLGKLDDIRKSVSYKEQAVLLTPDGHPHKPGRLSNLGSSYESLFQQLGGIDWIDKSISCKELAVLLTPDGHPDKPGRLNNLGSSYESLFQRLSRLDDIHKSVSYRGRAVVMTPDGHPDKPGYLNNLGSSYASLFQRLSRLDDIHKSVSYQEQAVMMTRDGHPDKPGYLNNLGSSYASLFRRHGRQEDIGKSVRYHEQAVSLTPDGHPDKPGRLNSLGSSYQSLYQRFGRLEAANQAVKCLKRAALLVPVDHPHQCIHLGKLGRIYWSMVKRSPDYRLPAKICWQHAALIKTGPPSIRLQLSRLWGLLSCHSDLPLALDGYVQCMILLPQVVWLGVRVEERYSYISAEVGILATEAAAIAISLQRYDLATEWLEQGRSIVWGQILQLRTPLDDLYTTDHEKAVELKAISYRLECAANSLPAGGEESADGTDLGHRWLAHRREELLDSIRLLPGFDDFLRPPKASKITSWIQDRTTVILNIHELRCDALVMQAGTQAITHVPLVEFSARKAENARAGLASCLLAWGIRRGVKKGDRQHKPCFFNVLAMLWHDVVKPVLDHLGIVHPLPIDELPHITWCTTGPLSFLPLHAAGDYSCPSTVLFNLAISSYTPTISSLRQPTSSPTTFSGILAVGHESATRGLHPLPGTREELDRIQGLARGMAFTRLDEGNACTDAVLKAMKDHSWVHFACHGSQDRSDPLKSALHLHDGDLDLATVHRHPFKNAQLAFLSACQTATGDSDLPDESIHLAAGLLMAGYQTVIATMWSISDTHAPLVAGKFYECVLEGGVPDSGKAAKALHEAVASLRETIGVEEFARWVPFMHIGR